VWYRPPRNPNEMATNSMSEVLQHLRRTVLFHDGAGLADGQLLEDYLSRHDEAALAALVLRHGPMVWGVCRRILRNHHDAEDAFQATFLVLVRKAASIMPRQMVANWLHGVAYQTALNARAAAARRQERQRPMSDVPEPAVTESDPWWDLQPLLDEELSRLPDRYRGVLVLCDLEGRTRKEAARMIGVPEGTVAGWVARARVLLAQRLAQRGVALSGGALAALLCQRASAAVPTALASSTIQVALTEGVVTTMVLPKLRMVLAALFLAMLACCGLAVLNRPATAVGQSPAPGRDGPKAAPTWKERLNMPYEGDAFYVFSIALSPDGKILATGINHFDPDRAGEVALWDTNTGKLVSLLQGHKELVHALAFAPDGRTLASASHDNTVKVWDRATGKELRSYDVTDSHWATTLVAFSPDGRTLAVGWAKGPGQEGVKLLDVASGNETARFPGFSAAFSPNGKFLATGTLNGELKLWDVATGRDLASREAHHGPVTSLAFSPDGKTLATVSNADDTVRLWDAGTAKERAVLRQATTSVCSLAFAPDGKSLAVGSHEQADDKVSGGVILWDPATGTKQAMLPVANGPVTAVAFASGTGELAAASYSALPGGDIRNFSKGVTRVRLQVWERK
jgi:RNA polymerase sigma factor (sigma-70 family)